MVKSSDCQTVYQVPKYGKPIPIVRGVTTRQARAIVRNARSGKNFFVGFSSCKKKVTNSSSFRTTK